MEKEFTEVYCGGGKGKTTLAIGQCLRASAQGKSVIIIQFLKGRERRELDFLEELDNLDIKIFRFEKHDEGYEELNDQEAREQVKIMLKQMAEKQGVTEQMKMQDQMKWVGLMNSIKACAEEIVLKERVYM